MARAAISTSLNVDSVFGMLAGFTSTATRAIVGTSSRSSSSRFDVSSALTKLIPVRFPPGRERLATNPRLTGSSDTTKTTGIVVVAALACQRRRDASGRGDHGNLPSHQVSRQLRNSIHLVIAPPVLDRHALALDQAYVSEALAKPAQAVGQRLGRSLVKQSDHRH